MAAAGIDDDVFTLGLKNHGGVGNTCAESGCGGNSNVKVLEDAIIFLPAAKPLIYN